MGGGSSRTFLLYLVAGDDSAHCLQLGHHHFKVKSCTLRTARAVSPQRLIKSDSRPLTSLLHLFHQDVSYCDRVELLSCVAHAGLPV